MIQITEKDIKEAKEKKCCPVCKGQRFWRSIIGTQDFEFDENGRVFWRDTIDKDPIDPEIDDVVCRICNDRIPKYIWRTWFEEKKNEKNKRERST